MTLELVAIALALMIGGLLYFHWSGKAFDRRYPRPGKPPGPAT